MSYAEHLKERTERADRHECLDYLKMHIGEFIAVHSSLGHDRTGEYRVSLLHQSISEEEWRDLVRALNASDEFEGIALEAAVNEEWQQSGSTLHGPVWSRSKVLGWMASWR